MFGSVGFSEVIVLALVAMLVVGPARLPKLAAQAGRMLRELRQMAAHASADLKAELGPEMADVSLRSLTPQRLVRDVLLSDAAPAVPPVPRTSPETAAAQPPNPGSS